MKNEAKIIITGEDRTAAAFAKVANQFDALQAKTAGISSSLAGLAGALGASLSVGGLSALVMQASQAVDEFNDLADVTGSSVESISALDRLARETGGNFETVAGSLTKFNQVLSSTDEEGSKAAAILKRMGLDAQALRSQDPAEALRQVAVAMGNFADDGAKGRAFFELFGKSAREMAPFMKDLAEQTSLVGTVTSESAAKAEAFNKAIYQLRATAQDAGRSLALEMLPSLVEISNELLAGMKHANGFIDAIITFGTINPFRSQKENIVALREEIEGLRGDRDRYLKSGSDTRGIDDAIKTVERKLNYLKDVQARNILSSMVGVDTGDALSRKLAPRRSIGDTAKQKTGDPLAEAKRFLESLQKQLEAVQNLTVEEKALNDIQLGRLGKVTPELQKQILATARLVDLTKAQKDSDKAQEEAAKRAAADAGRMAEQARSFAADVETPWERLQSRLEEIQKLGRDNPLINGEQLARANTKAWTEYLQTLETVAEQSKAITDDAFNFARDIQDFLGDSLYAALDGSFGDIEKSFGRMLKRMVAQAAQAHLNRYLFGDMMTGGSNLGMLGGFIGSLFPTQWPSFDMYGGITGAQNSAIMSAVNNGAFSSFAVGTDFVPRDMLAVVHKGEAIIPAHMNNGAGATYVSQNFTVGDVATMAQVQAAVRASQQQTIAALARSRTHGGAA